MARPPETSKTAPVETEHSSLASQQTSTIDDEIELETEEAGPVYQLIGRYSF